MKWGVQTVCTGANVALLACFVPTGFAAGLASHALSQEGAPDSASSKYAVAWLRVFQAYLAVDTLRILGGYGDARATSGRRYLVLHHVTALLCTESNVRTRLLLAPAGIASIELPSVVTLLTILRKGRAPGRRSRTAELVMRLGVFPSLAVLEATTRGLSTSALSACAACYALQVYMASNLVAPGAGRRARSR